MAAMDLQRGWGQERPELNDSFDSEMQEWEEQLQDMQRKIEELYSEVQARRGGANDVSIDDRKNGGGGVTDFGPEHRGHGVFDAPGCHGNNGNDNKDHPKTGAVPNHRGNSCNYGPNDGYGYPVNHQNGYGYPRADGGGSEIGDLLQDYLAQGKGMTRKSSSRARRVHFDDASELSQDPHVYQDETKRKSGNERIGPERFAGSFEEAENTKNRTSHPKSSPCKEGSPNKENTDAKPPLRQRDALPTPPRGVVPQSPADSPALERKSYNSGVLVDNRKGGSPSVLRKFGAMLQENEGKTLTDNGVVTQQVLAPEPKCLSPGCQRKGLWAPAASGRAPTTRVPAQKCQADSSAAEMDPGQEGGVAVVDSGSRHSRTMEQKGGHGHPKGPQQAQRRAQQVPGSPKPRPRAYSSGTDRDTGVGQGERARRPAPQLGTTAGDYRVLGGSSGAQRSQRVGPSGQSGPGNQDDGLIELLEMLEIEHRYNCSPRTGHTAHRQDPKQVSPADSSGPATHNRSFSRPARPANQRPPSRWASSTPTATITAPSGPMCRAPSPLARPPNPMARTPSPARKQQQQQQQPPFPYSRHTETIIM